MRAVQLSELRDLLQGAPFAAWRVEYGAACAAEQDARTRLDRLSAQLRQDELTAEAAQREAIDTFSAAGDAEDEAVRAGAEAQAHENRALAQVGSFEEQRFRTSDLWYRLGGAERTVEVRREQLAEASQAGPEGERLRVQAEAALRAAERQRRALEEEYAAEDRKRGRLWDEVEAAWGRSFERSLLAAEHVARSRRVRRAAERFFKEAEEKRAAAKQVRAGAEAAARELAEVSRRRAALRDAAGERFGCAAGEAFLYWRHRDDQQAAFAVALADDPTGWSLPVEALEVYTVGQVRGVALLEPARDGLARSVEQGDRRFEDYFLGPRRTAPRDEEPDTIPSKVPSEVEES